MYNINAKTGLIIIDLKNQNRAKNTKIIVY